jgi:hypothetical protein
LLQWSKSGRFFAATEQIWTNLRQLSFCILVKLFFSSIKQKWEILYCDEAKSEFQMEVNTCCTYKYTSRRLENFKPPEDS